MSYLKAIIVDEERLARVSLRRLLGHFPEIEIAGEADSCARALELISCHNPRLIFLDLQLRGETGFDLLELIDNSINIIFVTAYEKNAICTIEVNNMDYLTKPVNPERLKDAIERVNTRESKPKNETEIYCNPGNKKGNVVITAGYYQADHLSFDLTADHNNL